MLFTAVAAQWASHRVMRICLVIARGRFLAQGFWHEALRLLEALIVQLLIPALTRWGRRWCHIYIGDESATKHGVLSSSRPIARIVCGSDILFELSHALDRLQIFVFLFLYNFRCIILLVLLIVWQVSISQETIDNFLILVHLTRWIASQTDCFLHLAWINHAPMTFMARYRPFGEHRDRFTWSRLLHHRTQHCVGHRHHWRRLADWKSRVPVAHCRRCRRRARQSLKIFAGTRNLR